MIYVRDTECKCPACDQQTKQQRETDYDQNDYIEFYSYNALSLSLPLFIFLLSISLLFSLRVFLPAHGLVSVIPNTRKHGRVLLAMLNCSHRFSLLFHICETLYYFLKCVTDVLRKLSMLL